MKFCLNIFNFKVFCCMHLLADNVLMKVLIFCIGEGMVIFPFYGIFTAADFIVVSCNLIELSFHGMYTFVYENDTR